jgi:hypothetical protein
MKFVKRKINFFIRNINFAARGGRTPLPRGSTPVNKTLNLNTVVRKWRRLQCFRTLGPGKDLGGSRLLMKVRERQDVQGGTDKVKLHGSSVDPRLGWTSSEKPTDLLAMLQGQDMNMLHCSWRPLADNCLLIPPEVRIAVEGESR